MSYTTIYSLYHDSEDDLIVEESLDLKNGFGSAFFIWDKIFHRHFKRSYSRKHLGTYRPIIDGDYLLPINYAEDMEWIFKFSKMQESPDAQFLEHLPIYEWERDCMTMTLNLFLLQKSDYARAAEALRLFVYFYGHQGRACNLLEIAHFIDKKSDPAGSSANIAFQWHSAGPLTCGEILEIEDEDGNLVDLMLEPHKGTYSLRDHDHALEKLWGEK